MIRSELKRAIKAAVPSVYFVMADGLGTKTPRYRLECWLPLEDVPALVAFAASIDKRAYSLYTSGLYGYVTRCINVEGN